MFFFFFKGLVIILINWCPPFWLVPQGTHPLPSMDNPSLHAVNSSIMYWQKGNSGDNLTGMQDRLSSEGMLILHMQHNATQPQQSAYSSAARDFIIKYMIEKFPDKFPPSFSPSKAHFACSDWPV